MESMLEHGGVIVDFHSCDFFPERWFDLVVVLRTDNTILYPRLEKRFLLLLLLLLNRWQRLKKKKKKKKKRGYSQKKIMENVECEIMQVLIEEARESYKEEIVKELQSDTIEQMQQNVSLICEWVQRFQQQQRL